LVGRGKPTCDRWWTRSSTLRGPVWLRHVFADGGYAGPKLEEALADKGCWDIEIVQRSDAAKGFVPLPRCWAVERTFALLSRCRRVAKDFEASITGAETWLFVASTRIFLRRLSRPHR
jgi:transposase